MEEMKNENMKTILECIKSVVKLHNKRNLWVKTIASNDKFDTLQNVLKENAMLNTIQWQQTNMLQKWSTWFEQ